MNGTAAFFTTMLESSEMFCSLKYEDVKGCPYYLFSSRDVAAMSMAISALALISLIAGS